VLAPKSFVDVPCLLVELVTWPFDHDGALGMGEDLTTGQVEVFG
jgi:hypothetical protein